MEKGKDRKERKGEGGCKCGTTKGGKGRGGGTEKKASDLSQKEPLYYAFALARAPKA